VAVGIDSEAFMFFATAAAAPRRTLVSSAPFLSAEPLAGFGAGLDAAAGLEAAGFGAAAVLEEAAGWGASAGFAGAAGFAEEFSGVVDEAEVFGAAFAAAVDGLVAVGWEDFSVVFTSAPFEPPAAAASGE